MFSVKNHLLCIGGAYVMQKPSPNHGGIMKPTLLVMHYTGSPSTTGAIRTLTDGNAANRVSAHLVISPEGVITQLVPFDKVAWHAGVSKWNGKEGCNSFAIGIEMVNSGLLGKGPNGYFDRLTNKPVPANQVVIATHKNGDGGECPWEIYPLAQVEAATGAARAILAAYGIKEVVGHDDIAPHRKIDPGPAWPMDAFKKRVLGVVA